MPTLTRAQEDNLIRILSRHPDFQTAEDRLRLLLQIIPTAADGDETAYHVNLGKDAIRVAEGLLAQLKFEGVGPDGVHRLRHMVAGLREKVRDERDRGRLAGMLTYLDQHTPAVAPPPPPPAPLRPDPQPRLDPADWRGKNSDAPPYEKVVRVNTLRQFYLLERAVPASRGVFRIEGRPPGTEGEPAASTGFLIARGVETAPGGPRVALAMTNHHVIATLEEFPGYECWFNYRLDLDGREPVPSPQGFCKLQPLPLAEWFFTDAGLDVTVFALDDAVVPANAVALGVREARPLEGARVPIIQHPNGEYLQISFQSNFIAYANDEILQYTTTTLPGSSGSPVFNERFEVIGIHSMGGDLPHPGQPGLTTLINQGTSIKAILAVLPGAIRGRVMVLG